MAPRSTSATPPSVANEKILQMYEKFFGLHHIPFKMVPDPDCLHMTGQHADVISGAVFGILERKGFVVLTGEAGLGKTTAIRAVTAMLEESQAYVSIISHPTLNASDFLELAMLNFGLPEFNGSKAQRLKLLETFLTDADAQGRICTLIIDEAHKLTPDALEEVRLLGNFESGSNKLLQILLVGQNELNARLNLPDLWQLKQRIAYRLTLNRLDREGVEQYLRYRWKHAGGTSLPFEPSAIDAIAKWALGTPRVINAVCDNALMLALSEATRTVGLGEIQRVREDLHLATPALTRRTDADEPVAVRTDLPKLVRAASKGGSGRMVAATALSVPSVPMSNLAPQESAAALAAAAAAATEQWAESRPWLVRKWRGLMDGHKPSQTSRPSPSLSLKQHM